MAHLCCRRCLRDNGQVLKAIKVIKVVEGVGEVGEGEVGEGGDVCGDVDSSSAEQ